MNTALITQWTVSPQAVPYDAAMIIMENRIAAISAGSDSELVWLLEHPNLYTAGASAKPQDLLDAAPNFPVFRTGRGGQYTWHGPGQRIVYLMLDLNQRGRDLRRFVTALEDWLIESLQALGVAATRLPNRVGLWVARPDRGFDHADKIAAIGLKLRKWVSFHGISLNLNPDLSAYAGIVPCGNALPQFGSTSLQALGVEVSMSELDAILHQYFVARFGQTIPATPPVLPMA